MHIASIDLLHECITFAPASHGISVEIDKFKFSEWFKDLFDIRFCEVEM